MEVRKVSVKKSMQQSLVEGIFGRGKMKSRYDD